MRTTSEIAVRTPSPEPPPATRANLPCADSIFPPLTELFEVRNGNTLVIFPLPYREKLLMGLLDFADQCRRKEKVYAHFNRLLRTWPDCRKTSFRTNALIRLTSQLLHQTDPTIRELIHFAIDQLKANNSTDSPLHESV